MGYLKNGCFFFFLLAMLHLVGQSHTSIGGFVKDAQSGEKMSDVAVYDSLSGVGLYSDTKGFFSMSLPATAPYVLKFEFPGYETLSLKGQARQDTLLYVLLKTQGTDTVAIVATEGMVLKRTQMSVVDIPVRQIKLIPALLGETDLLKAFQLMPGIKGGAEGSTGLYVRGGSPDQNLMLLDNVPLYYVSHLGGFVSAFDPNAIGSVKLYKGAFPARFGGRLSSVVDIQMKEGDQYKWQKTASLGVLSAKFCADGPLKKEKTTLLVSGRLSTFGPISYLLSQAATEGNLAAAYNFYDLYVKFRHNLSLRDKLTFSFYKGADNLLFTQRSKFSGEGGVSILTRSRGGMAWGNTLLASKWTHLYTPKLLHTLTASFTDFDYNLFMNASQTISNTEEVLRRRFRYDFHSGIRDVNLRWDFDYFPHSRHQIKYGALSTFHTFTPGFSLFLGGNGDSLTAETGNKRIYSVENAAYIEDEWSLNEKISVNMGLNATVYVVEGKAYKGLQPRLGGLYKLNPKLSFKAAYARMQQFMHLLSRSNIGFPSDLWLPVTKNISPQTADHFALGFVRLFPRKGWELSSELYYKHLRGLVTYRDGSNLALATEWEKAVETGGKGWAYGWECMLQKKTGKTTGWIGYTLSYNNRQFRYYNDGKIFPFLYDRRHDFSLVLNHEFSTKLTFNLNWVYTSGRAATLARGVFGAANLDPNQNYSQTVLDLGQYYGEKNSFRLPAYHRLDVSLILHKTKHKGSRDLSIGFYNLYNRQNPFLYYYQYNPTTQASELYQYTLFPMLPFVSYTRNF